MRFSIQIKARNEGYMHWKVLSMSLLNISGRIAWYLSSLFYGCSLAFKPLANLPSAFISLPKIREGGPLLDLPLGYKHTSFTSSTLLFQLEDHVSEEDISLPMDKLDHRELMVSCVG